MRKLQSFEHNANMLCHNVLLTIMQICSTTMFSLVRYEMVTINLPVICAKTLDCETVFYRFGLLSVMLQNCKGMVNLTEIYKYIIVS